MGDETETDRAMAAFTRRPDVSVWPYWRIAQLVRSGECARSEATSEFLREFWGKVRNAIALRNPKLPPL